MEVKDSPSRTQTTASPPEIASPPETASTPEARPPSIPLWISLSYLGGLALLYLGQRVLVDFDGLATSVSVIGAVALVLATAARFLPQFRGRGDHAPIAKLLSGFQLLGIVGVVVWWLSSDGGRAVVGWAESDPETSVATVLWVFCIAASVLPLTFAEFALHPMRNAPTLEGRRVSFAAISGLSVALAVSYGSLFVYTAAQAEAQADFSYFKTSQPSDATVKLVQKLSEPAEVTGFFPAVSEVRKEVNSYFSALKERSGNLEYTLVDRYLDPQKAKELRVTQDGTIVLMSGETKRNIQIGTDVRAARAKLVKLDEEVNSHLGKIARDRRVAYMTVGHGELNDRPRGERKSEGREAKLLRKILEQQNYRIRDLGLNQGLGERVPEDADLVMVLGPVYPFAPEEIRSLKEYADAGGKLFMALDVDSTIETDTLAIDPSLEGGAASASGGGKSGADGEGAGGAGANVAAKATAGDAVVSNAKSVTTSAAAEAKSWLKELASAVGAHFEPVVLADEKKHVVRFHNDSDRSLLRTNRFSTHASVSTLSKNSTRATVVAFGASPLLKVDSGDYKTDVAVRSFASTFNDKNGNFKSDKGEVKKTYNLAVAITKAAGAQEPPASSQDEADGQDADQDSQEDKDNQGASPKEMRAFVIGDADALSDLVLEPSRANRVLAFDAVRWLVGEESLAGEFENEEDVPIEQTKQLDLAWFYATIFGIPALVLGAGLTTSSRARRTGKRPADKQKPRAKSDPPTNGPRAQGEES